MFKTLSNCLQRLQSPDTLPGCNRSCQEWEERRACLTKACDPANAAGKKPVRQDARRMVHYDRVDRPEKHADERNGHSISSERGDEPDDEFEPNTY